MVLASEPSESAQLRQLFLGLPGRERDDAVISANRSSGLTATGLLFGFPGGFLPRNDETSYVNEAASLSVLFRFRCVRPIAVALDAHATATAG